MRSATSCAKPASWSRTPRPAHVGLWRADAGQFATAQPPYNVKKGRQDRLGWQEPPIPGRPRTDLAGRRAAVAQGVFRGRTAPGAHRVDAGEGAPDGRLR